MDGAQERAKGLKSSQNLYIIYTESKARSHKTVDKGNIPKFWIGQGSLTHQKAPTKQIVCKTTFSFQKAQPKIITITGFTLQMAASVTFSETYF